MIKKLSGLSILFAFLIAACSPTDVVVETSAADSEEVMAIEDSSDEAMDGEEHADEPVVVDEQSDDLDAAPVAISFSADVWPIIEMYALNAHGGNGGIFLENFSDILAQVIPGDPEGSTLYKALVGDGIPQMPPGNPLSDDLIQTIYGWIEQGALDN